jgi:hypothetical protein
VSRRDALARAPHVVHREADAAEALGPGGDRRGDDVENTWVGSAVNENPVMKLATAGPPFRGSQAATGNLVAPGHRRSRARCTRPTTRPPLPPT